VPGPVNVECGGVLTPERCHSAPFGNWGVKTVYSGYHDGFQWSGWHNDKIKPWLQWNSCTGEPKYNNPEDLPENPQITYGGVNTHALYVLRLPRGASCAALNNKTMTFHTEYMKLYELDSAWDFLPPCFGNGSDYVTTVNFPPITFTVTCSASGICRGQSAWADPLSTNKPAHSKMRIQVYAVDY